MNATTTNTGGTDRKADLTLTARACDQGAAEERSIGMSDVDVVVLGAGAAGLMCAIEAGKRGRRVLVLEKTKEVGAKIRISGGGRCNFTNLHTTPEDFLSQNPAFCRSALARFTPQDFIALVDGAGVQWHEKTIGQLFCTEPGAARLIVELLLDACMVTGNVEVVCEAAVAQVRQCGEGFEVEANGKTSSCTSVVVATGGPSIPAMGSTGFGYRIAEQFDLSVLEPTPALVPFTLSGAFLEQVSELSGVSLPVVASCGRTRFEEAMLFTHRGLSGPAVLQLSSYWSVGQSVTVDLLGAARVEELVAASRRAAPKRGIAAVLADRLPKRLVAALLTELGIAGPVGQLSSKAIQALSQRIHRWTFKPAGTEGWRTAEVTRGGVSTRCLSSKTMECRTVAGLYFIGEVVDVTGHLGGFNFQWAWASGYAAGQSV